MTINKKALDEVYHTEVQKYLDPFLQNQGNFTSLSPENQSRLFPQIESVLNSTDSDDVSCFAIDLLEQLPQKNQSELPLPFEGHVQDLTNRLSLPFSAKSLMEIYTQYGITQLCHRVIFSTDFPKSYKNISFPKPDNYTPVSISLPSFPRKKLLSTDEISAESKKIARAMHRALSMDFPSQTPPNRIELEKKSTEFLAKSVRETMTERLQTLLPSLLDEHAIDLLLQEDDGKCIVCINIKKSLENTLPLKFPGCDFASFFLQEKTNELIQATQKELQWVHGMIKLPLQQEIARIKTIIQTQQGSAPSIQKIPSQEDFCQFLDNKLPHLPETFSTERYTMYRDAIATKLHRDLQDWISLPVPFFSEALSEKSPGKNTEKEDTLELSLIEKSDDEIDIIGELLSPVSQPLTIGKFPIPKELDPPEVETMESAIFSYLEQALQNPKQVLQRKSSSGRLINAADSLVHDLFIKKIQPKWPRYNIMSFTHFMNQIPFGEQKSRLALLQEKIENRANPPIPNLITRPPLAPAKPTTRASGSRPQRPAPLTQLTSTVSDDEMGNASFTNLQPARFSPRTGEVQPLRSPNRSEAITKFFQELYRNNSNVQGTF